MIKKCETCARGYCPKSGNKLAHKRCNYYVAEATHKPEAVKSNSTDGLCNPPVQAIKDAMWLIDNVLLNHLRPEYKDMRKNSLRELHNYLDRLGA